MALDGAYLRCIRDELRTQLGARIEKIYQPTRDELLIALRSREGAAKILLSCAADRARIHLTRTTPENPKVPPMFCMLLRKRLGSGKLMSVRQIGLERVLYLDFSCINELGDPVTLTLAAEIMGRYSNIILIDEDGTVIDSMKRVDAAMTTKRLVLPHMRYEMPPRDDRLDFLMASDEVIRQALHTHNGDLSKELLHIFEGVSPVLVREWADYAGNGAPLRCESMSDDQTDRLLYILHRTKQRMESNECTFVMLSNRDGLPKDFSFIPIHQYGSAMITKEFPDASTLLDQFYAQRDRTARLHSRADDLFRLLLQASGRIGRRLAAQTAELEDCAKKDDYKRCGDLLYANLYRLEKGQKTALVEDFYDEANQMTEISLDERLTPAQNAESYFRRYRKLSTAQSVLKEQISAGEQELVYLDSVLDELTRAQGEEDLEMIRAELAQSGYIRRGRSTRQPAAKPPLTFYASDGTKILVGRNNQQNDQLTLRIAHKNDIWLHTQNIPGSHVILCTQGKKLPLNIIIEAAQIAARHSKARNSAQVPVDYCAVHYVKKPAGAKPGMVIFSNQHTVYVKPAEETEHE